jgi:ATP-dependent RNA helicase RhlE
MNFSSLGFAPDLLRGIKACGYQTLTPIQEQAIPPARRGRDLLATAQTGTGKTAAYALPILQQLLDRPAERTPGAPRVLILAPTRELVEQVADHLKQFAQFLPLQIAALYGGVKLTGQTNKLKAGVDILVATPGRLLEHIKLCNVHLAKTEFIVLDEADRMLDMGFVTDIQTVLRGATHQHQTLLFSATVSHAVTVLAHTLLKNPVNIATSKQNTTADTVSHVVYLVEERRKHELFKTLLQENNWYKVLAFTSTKEQADKLIASLKEDKISAGVCHGDKSQGARRRALQEFKDDKIQVLVATEVAARGLDIEALDHVVNVNLPYLPEDYVHRIGRTGRAGTKGQAISFVSREEERALGNIEALIGSKIRRIVVEGFEVSDRTSLLNTLANKPARAKRTNKATATRIQTEKTAIGRKDNRIGTLERPAKTNRAVKNSAGAKSARPAKASTTRTDKAPTKKPGKTADRSSRSDKGRASSGRGTRGGSRQRQD